MTYFIILFLFSNKLKEQSEEAFKDTSKQNTEGKTGLKVAQVLLEIMISIFSLDFIFLVYTLAWIWTLEWRQKFT